VTSCLCLAGFFYLPAAQASPVELRAKTNTGQDLKMVSVATGNGETPVWRWDQKTGDLVFKPPASVTIPADGVVYLKVVYLDQGYGKLRVLLPGGEGKPVRPDRYLGIARGNTNELVSARMRFSGVQLPPGGELDARIGVDHSDGAPLRIASVTLQETPFADPAFAYVISDPWNGPYTGPAIPPKDNTTLKGKVMVGYQGWFRTPNDPDGNAWNHWGNIPQGSFSVDMWPDISQYPPGVLEKAAGVKLKSGKQAWLFSSAWPEVANTHFRWMREHEIDGAFLQRFVGSINSIKGKPERVLANVRAAANREGRLWAVEYDVSGGNDATVCEILKKDWMWMVDTFGVLKDPAYAREGGKPVVFVWGLPFKDRNFSPDAANAAVEFFKNDPVYGGNYVIGGIPGDWRKLDARWQEHIKKYDCVLPWMSQSYAEDIADLKNIGISYYAHVKPGFSWANLKHLPTGDTSVAYTPREGGRFYWNLLSKAAQAGVDRLFVGMFDEYDEGTAIMPMSDDPPPTPSRPGVAATFYNGTRPDSDGESVLLPTVEVPLGDIPPGKKTAPRNFFVKMSGQITFPQAGDYIFSIEGAPGDDAELVVDGKKILSAKNLAGTAVAKIPITAVAGDPPPFRLEYRHKSGSGTLRLFCESADVARQVVPDIALRDAWGRFITNDGMPADWWLQLTRMGKEMMNGKRKIDFVMPEGAGQKSSGL